MKFLLFANSAVPKGCRMPIISIVRIMRYTTITLAIIFTSCGILMAGSSKGQDIETTEVQMSITNKSLEYSFKQIEKQTTFRFAYKREDIKSYKQLTIKDGTYAVSKLLRLLLAQTELEFRQENSYILIEPKLQTAGIIQSGQAQDLTVKGKITDVKGIPLAGVTVKPKDGTGGVVSAADGTYSIKIANGDGTLVFSFIGFVTQELHVNNRTTLDVVLQESNQALSEVVVVGYGSQKKKDITSAISTVSTRDISSRPIVSAVEAITGKSAGVQVSIPSGAPGGDLSVKIRGIGSPNGGEPLYVVDGVLANDIRAIDPNTIESMSILKDASAAGIYGAAGSTNGVVIITTKHGTKGKPRTDINFYTGMQQIVKKLSVLNNAQFLSLQKEITGADLKIPAYYDLTNTNNNWQDQVYHNAMQTGVNMSTSGGSEKGTFYLGGGYLNQDGIIVGSSYKRYSAKFSAEQNATDWLKIGGDFSYNRTTQRTVTDNASANFGGVVIAALVTPQYIPVRMPTGSPNPGVYGTSNFYSGENPISDIYNNTNKTIGNNLLGNVYTDVKLPFDLKYRSQLNVIVENSKYDYFQDPYSSLSGLSNAGTGRTNYSEVSRWAWDNTLTYNKILGRHSINVVAGTSALEEKIGTSNASGNGFSSNAVQTLNGASSNFVIGSGNFQWSTNSYFGRVNYSYNDRYLLTATFRRDGSSRVGNNVVWGNFPAVSAGWRVSSEDFMKDVTWVQNLKIRAGWGETGNLPPFTMLYPSYSLLNAGSPYAYGGGAAIPGINPSGQFGNPNLKWESAQQTNIGFDASFFQSRVTLTVDYYHKKVRDLIFTQQLPLTTGGSFTALNLPGNDINKGVELGIEADVLKGSSFSWSTNFNASYNKNLISGIDPTISFQTGPLTIGGSKAPIYTQIIKNGYPLGTFWGYQTKGVDPQTGNFVYSDNPQNLGSAIPKYNFGFSNTFTYQALSLSVLMDAVQGNKVYNATRMETEALSGYTNESTDVLRRWEKPGDITDIPRALGNGTTNTAAAALLQSRIASNYLEDGSFIRMRNVTLSYQFDKGFLKTLGLAGAKFYVSAQNLFIISKYKGYYPEVNGYGLGTNNQAVNAGAGVSLLSLGVDRGTYPPAKIFTAGINVQF
ncbi:TonB-dependent receptor [Mucilaginibacter sp. cycad4]|uniref:TonB-dependent receptor n=1 Tax=Mucilaginibacter sp. cycad4 TaxID=3342096 RepID=UPI002AAC2CB8|nr:TonB-dependent receptor [Mucilaginibacter gossypii]WPV01938.1 TonB-dependent receptor [Mucilaginibacter gossypii]